MNNQQTILYMGASHDPVSLEKIMEMQPGIYIGTTLKGERAVIKVSSKEPVINMQVVVDGGHVHVTEYYSNHTIHEYDKDIQI